MTALYDLLPGEKESIGFAQAQRANFGLAAPARAAGQPGGAGGVRLAGVIPSLIWT